MLWIGELEAARVFTCAPCLATLARVKTEVGADDEQRDSLEGGTAWRRGADLSLS